MIPSFSYKVFLICLIVLCIKIYSYTQPLYNLPKRLNIENTAFQFGINTYSSNTYGVHLGVVSSYFSHGSLALKLNININAVERTNTADTPHSIDWAIHPITYIGIVFVPTKISFHKRKQFLSNPRKRIILENGSYLKTIYLEHIRFYIDGGMSFMIGDTISSLNIKLASTKIPYAIGIYSTLGVEFSFNDVENTFGSYYIEIGGAFSGIIAHERYTPSFPSSGLLFRTGLRFYLPYK